MLMKLQDTPFLWSGIPMEWLNMECALSWFQPHHAGLMNPQINMNKRGWRRNRKLTNRTREPFALQLWRDKLYILTAPEDVALAYKNTTTLSWDAFLNDLLEGFGLRGKSLELAWHQPKPGDAAYECKHLFKSAQKSLVHFTEEISRRQLLPGEHLKVMEASFLERLHETLQWDQMIGSDVLHCSGMQKRLSLKGFFRYLVVDAITYSIFGGTLQQIHPNVARDMITFNDDAWMVVFRYPEFSAPNLVNSKRRIKDALKTYMSLPDEQRKKESFAITNILEGQKITGIDDESRVAMLLMIYWAWDFILILHFSIFSECRLTDAGR